MNVAEAIRMKRAVRQFAPDPLPEEIIHKILQAGRRAQSAKNTQPWRFIAIREKARLDELSKLGTYAGHLSGAAMAVAILTPDPDQRWSIMFDAGQAAAYMQLAAWELGVVSCLATIYEPEKARQLLGFPKDLFLHVAISFGFPADPVSLHASPRKGGRKIFSEITHFERWSGTT
jgi:nitroreductase